MSSSIAAAAEPGDPAPLLAVAPLASLSATRDRPLFAPERRAPAAPLPVTPPAPPPKPAVVEEPPRFTLLGIVRAPDRGGSVVLMDDAAHASFSLKLGEGRRGWILQSLDSDAVTLANGRRSVRLTYARPPQAPRVPAN